MTTRYIFPRLGLGTKSADPGSTNGVFVPKNAQLVISAIDKIRLFSDRNGAKLAILYCDLREPAPNDVAHARDRLFIYAKDNRVNIIRPNLNKYNNGHQLFRYNIHPNIDGNNEIAKLLSRNNTLWNTEKYYNIKK